MNLKTRIQILFGVAGICAFTAILRDNDSVTGIFIIMATIAPAFALLDFSLAAKRKGFILEGDE